MNMDRGGLIAPIVVAAALAAGTYWLDRVSQLPANDTRGYKPGKPDVVMRRFKATQTGVNGVEQYVVTADRAHHYPVGNYTELFTVDLVDLSPSQPPMRLNAEDVRVTHDDEVFFFDHKVLMTRDADAEHSKLHMVTTKLWAWPRSGVVKTDQPVELWDDNLRVTAVGMEVDRNTQIIKLKSRVKAIYAKPQV